MCMGSCAKCLGGTLIPLAVIGLLANILLFFPGGKVSDSNDHITDEVWYFGGIAGSGVLMIFPALVFLGLKNNDCCGCCGNESCGKRFAVEYSNGHKVVIGDVSNHQKVLTLLNKMFTSTIFAAIGFVGAGYSFIISAVAINKGPKCLIDGTTWGYPFENGDYLGNHSLWSRCQDPRDIVPWNLTLFSILLVVGVVQMCLCAIQVINGLLGTLCGDCRCCCGGDGPV